jgi:HD-GYP domain-containing protein (c-di-GMP phosphodiesterase class II)
MSEPEKFLKDEQLKKLMRTVYDEVKLFADSKSEGLKKLAKIGIALSAEKNTKKLLEMIVTCARDFTNADAGTLYTVDETNKRLNFEIIQNDSLGTKLGGVSGGEIELPPVPLEIEGQPNYSNVSSYVALSGKTINIADVYEAKDFDFTGPRKYDEQTGYRSRSMLVIPLKNHANEIIGVLQLLNAKDLKSNEVIAFSEEYMELISALASQAAVALENNQLIEDLRNLFDSFIQGIATAIDEKSPYTGGHIRRVTELTMKIANEINSTLEGSFANKKFTNDELEELRIATWLHDVGKITTPEFIIDKATKLETIFDRGKLIETRFELIKQSVETNYLKEKIKLIESKKENKEELNRIYEKFCQDIENIEAEKEFITQCNIPGEFREEEEFDLLQKIGHKSYLLNGTEEKYLSDDELYNLSIRKGSLTKEEREKIKDHVLMSIKILEKLPFPKKLSRVSEFAGGHHELLDGSGYPKGLTAEQLPLQARIMALADIFESLTAKDRPYKKPLKLSETIKILTQMRKENKIDPDLFELFINSNILKDYTKKELNPEQLDVDIKV